MKKVILFIMTVLLVTALFGENKADNEPGEVVTSILEDWRDTLLYGISEDVIKVIREIKKVKENSLNPELVILFKESLDDKLKLEILGLFTETEYKGLEVSALKILQEYEEYSRIMTITVIKYLAAIESIELPALAGELLDATDDDIAIAMINALGDLEDISNIDLLLEKFTDDDYPLERKPQLILTLGKTGAAAAVKPLIEVVDNPEEEKIWRMYACDALGKIGDPEAVPHLEKLFNESDALIRAYAASALAAFDLPEITDILIQGLRDSNWKVRERAARGLAKPNAAKALEILKYKVKKDPAVKVKYESIRALGAIGCRDCFDFLKEIYLEEKQPHDIRDTALQVLLEQDLEYSLDVIMTIIKQDMNKPMGKSKIIESTAKRLFIIESVKLKEVFDHLLDSKNWLLRIYGIRGIVNNKMTSFRDRIVKLAEDDPVVNVKKEALSALGKL